MTGTEAGAAPEPTVRLPVAVLAVLASVVVALLVVALVVRLGEHGLPSGPPRDPPPPPPAATRLSVADGEVRFQELKVDLPGSPYGCDGDYPQRPAAFDQLALCEAVVHKDYDGKGNSWYAVSGVGLLGGSVVVPGDLEKTTASVFDAIVGFSFSAGDHPRLSGVSSAAATVPAPPGHAWTRQGDVYVHRPGLPTTHDRLVVIAVQLESGRVVAFYSDFPHDGSKTVLQAVVRSASSLSAQR